MYGWISTNEKSYKKLTALLAGEFFIKKAPAHRAQRPNSERNLYVPPYPDASGLSSKLSYNTKTLSSILS
jgi:hypothetical protein